SQADERLVARCSRGASDFGHAELSHACPYLGRCQIFDVGTCRYRGTRASKLQRYQHYRDSDRLADRLPSVWKADGDTHVLRVTEQDEPGAWRLTLEGTLSGRWVAEGERVWWGAPAEKPREVDLRGVTSVDGAGRDLLHRMHREGANFVAEGV